MSSALNIGWQADTAKAERASVRVSHAIGGCLFTAVAASELKQGNPSLYPAQPPTS